MAIRRSPHRVRKSLWCGCVPLCQAFIWLKPDVAYRKVTLCGVKSFYYFFLCHKIHFLSLYKWWLRTMRWTATRSSSALQAPCPSSRCRPRQVHTFFFFLGISSLHEVFNAWIFNKLYTVGYRDSQIQAINFQSQFPSLSEGKIISQESATKHACFFRRN